MATTTTHTAYATIASVLTTELNSLATATNTAASAAQDNTSVKDLLMDIELVLAAQGSARSAGALVAIFLVEALDGTNYGDVSELTAEPVAVFSLDAATTARRAVRRDVPCPPGLFKLFARNVTGQALAASGNTVKIRTHSLLTT